MFADGAGTRALSMGGAYAALSDDATDFLWNPGGLARVSRLGFELGQTSYSIEGIQETHAAFALPSWRWGAVAAGFRQFSVGGIDVRDDRNLSTGDETPTRRANSYSDTAARPARTGDSASRSRRAGSRSAGSPPAASAQTPE